MRTSTSTSITDIDPAAWDALDTGGVALPAPRIPRGAGRRPAASDAAPAGTRADHCCTTNAASPPRRRPTSRRIRSASSCSIIPGRRPTRSMGSTTTRSWCSACRSPRPPVARLLVRPDRRRRDDARGTDRTPSASSPTRAALSSMHGLFVDASATARHSRQHGWLSRRDVQFHWHNRGYRDFDHYLEGFTADKSARRPGASAARRPRKASLCETLLGPQLDRHTDRRDLRPAPRHLSCAMARALSHARVLPRAAAGAGRELHGDQARAPRRRNRWRPPCSSGAGTRCTAATGARTSSSTACISRPAITRASTSASSGASRGSSPARRANTR